MSRSCFGVRKYNSLLAGNAVSLVPTDRTGRSRSQVAGGTALVLAIDRQLQVEGIQQSAG
jgi:hypothetical protein